MTTADSLAAAEAAWAASTQTGDPAAAALYLACARGFLTQSEATVERLRFVIAARETELVRADRERREAAR